MSYLAAIHNRTAHYPLYIRKHKADEQNAKALLFSIESSKF